MVDGGAMAAGGKMRSHELCVVLTLLTKALHMHMSTLQKINSTLLPGFQGPSGNVYLASFSPVLQPQDCRSGLSDSLLWVLFGSVDIPYMILI